MSSSSSLQSSYSTRKSNSPAATTMIVTLTETYSASRTWSHTHTYTSSSDSPSATAHHKPLLLNTKYGVGPVVGIAVGGVVFIALALSFFHSCRRRIHLARKRPRGSKLETEKAKSAGDPEMGFLNAQTTPVSDISTTPVSTYISSQRRASSEVSASGFQAGYPPMPLPSPHQQFFALQTPPASSDRGGVGATDGWLARNASPPNRNQSLPSLALHMPIPAPRPTYPYATSEAILASRPVPAFNLTPPPAAPRSKKKRGRAGRPTMQPIESPERPPSPSLSHRSRTRRGSSTVDVVSPLPPPIRSLNRSSALPRSHSEGRVTPYLPFSQPPDSLPGTFEHSLSRSPSEDVGYALYMDAGRKPFESPKPAPYPSYF